MIVKHNKLGIRTIIYFFVNKGYWDIIGRERNQNFVWQHDQTLDEIIKIETEGIWKNINKGK